MAIAKITFLCLLLWLCSSFVHSKPTDDSHLYPFSASSSSESAEWNANLVAHGTFAFTQPPTRLPSYEKESAPSCWFGKTLDEISREFLIASGKVLCHFRGSKSKQTEPPLMRLSYTAAAVAALKDGSLKFLIECKPAGSGDMTAIEVPESKSEPLFVLSDI